MNRFCDLTSRSLDASDAAILFKRVRHLDTKVDVHRFIPVFWVVIEEHIMPRT